MKSFSLKKKILLLLFLSTTALSAWSNITNGRGEFNIDPDFHLLYGGAGTTIFGDFNATGNSILTSNNPNNANMITDITTFKTVDAAFNANPYSLADAEKMNSSSGQIQLPSYVNGSDIKWAGLFWQGHIFRPGNGIAYSDAQVDADILGWNSVTIKDSNGVMHQITAPVGSDDINHKAFYYKVRPDNNNLNNKGYRHFYGAYHEVTDIIKNSYSSTNNTFTVGNIKTTAGQDTSGYLYISNANPPLSGNNFQFGLYGGWSLIVVYSVDGAVASTNSVPLKTISIYDGFDLFLTWGDGTVHFETTIDISGFYTPKSGPVSSKLLFFGGAGDRGIQDDTLQIQNQDNIGTYTNLSNSVNTAGSQFNHTYSYLGNHMTPGDTNKQGMDLDIFDVSSQMTNKQSETKIKFGVVKSGNHCDQVFPQVIAFSTQLYQPKLCYDYAYSQNNNDFTDHTTADPRIIGSNISQNDTIDMKLFIRNEENSDIVAKNVVLNILDINTSQAIYENNSTQVTYPNQILKTDISENDIDSSDSYIKDITIGDVDSLEYFYAYYKLNPSVSDINMSINARVDYNVSIDTGSGSTLSFPYSLYLNSTLPICPGGGTYYNVEEGRFNIVHDNYVTLNSNVVTSYKNNLPTQVTQRAGNFRVISLDPDNTDTLKDINATVAVQLMNISGFSTPEAICYEDSNAIGERIWVQINANNHTSFNAQDIIDNILIENPDAAKEFYQNATRNAAFRIYYPPMGDADASGLIETVGGDNWKIVNYSGFQGQNCIYEFDAATYNPSNGNYQGDHTYKIANDACGSNGSGQGNNGMTDHELNVCFECIFGANLPHFCSRDNFSIRPEAFVMHIDDQNQTNPASQNRLTTNYSGVDPMIAIANIRELNISSGYNYNIEVNATNHADNNPSPGYIQSLDTGVNYIWEPRTITVANAVANCNDDNNKSTPITFINGVAETNSSVNQVGEYQLNILDTTWTAVDSDSSYKGHHIGAYFDTSTNSDCVTNSNIVQNTGITSPLNGCNISSNHTNNDANLIYNDYDVKFHPYQFLINTNFNIGIQDMPPTGATPFIYMADINTTSNSMAVDLNTTVSAVGYNSTTPLSNFTKKCYAKPLDINIAKSGAKNDALKYQYVFQDFNSSGSVIVDNVKKDYELNYDANVSFMVGDTKYFQQDQNGSITTITKLNFARDVNVTANPENINFTSYTVSDPRTTFNADLVNNKTATGVELLNQNVIHYYGRTHAGRQRYEVVNDNDPQNANIYYETYCFQTTNSNTCNPLLLQSTQRTDDIRWFQNINHVATNHGNVGIVNQINGGTKVSATTPVENPPPPTTTDLRYDASQGYPYKTTMENNASRWLIYNEDDPTATRNQFPVEFEKAGGGWSGEHETDTTTNDPGTAKTNRRSMW